MVMPLRDHPNRSSATHFRKHQVELYDTKVDPLCKNDLVHQEPGRAREMRATLIKWLLSRQELAWNWQSGTSPEMEAQLRALGYVTGEEVDAGEEVDRAALFEVECKCEFCREYD